jgi:hypothetical protein
MSKIEITGGVVAAVAVDGHDIARCVRSLELNMAASRTPQLFVTIAATEHDVRIENGEIHIRESLMPEAMERAILSCLLLKYPPVARGQDVTTLADSAERRYVPGVKG